MPNNNNPTVYVARDRYHRSYPCATSRFKDRPKEMKLDKAQAAGIRPCGRCAKADLG